MTRVNVDDVAFMDRRFKLLGGRLAITWQEALGRCLPVWALAYAKRTAILSAGDIDALAERPGFAAAMLAVDLAAEDEGGLYLRGVADRIDFLLIQDAKRERARAAKLAAAGVAVPRRPSRGRARDPEEHPAGPSPGTIPEEGPYSPDLDLDLDLDRDLSPLPRAIPPVPERAPTPTPTPAPNVPAVSPPSPAREDIARTQPAADLRTRGQLAEATYRRVSDARIQLAAELGLDAPIQFPEITPGWHPRGFVELQQRIREEGAQAATVCDRVVANLIAQAREDRSIEWLAEKAFGDKSWAHARDWTSKKRKQPRAAAKSAEQPLQVSTLTPEERLALAAESRAALFGVARAPPVSARPSDDEHQPATPMRTAT